MKRIIISILLVVVMISSILVGCGGKAAGNDGNKKASEAKASGTPIRVGLQPTCLGAPVGYAYENGFYEDEGLNIELIYFDTGAPENEAFAAGQLDIAASGLASVFSLSSGKATWLSEINTTGGQGIYFRPDNPATKVTTTTENGDVILGNKETVKGMQFLALLGTGSQYMVMNYCKNMGLEPDEYEIISMEFGPALQAFKAGEADALYCDFWYAIEAEDSGFIKAASFDEACGIEANDGIFADTEYIKSHREDVVKFLRATYKAVDELSDKETRHDFCLDWYTRNGREFTPKQMDKEIERRWFITGEMMGEEDYVMGEGVTKMAEFYVEDGKIPKENFPNVQKSYDPSYLEEALGITVKYDK